MTVVLSSSLACILGVAFLLLIPCDCLQLQLRSSSSDHDGKEAQVSVEEMLPRKLRVMTEKVTVTVQDFAGHKDSTSINYNPKQETSSGTRLKHKLKPENLAAAKLMHDQAETRQKWVEDGGDSSEFFTMDYRMVRRRRPIHNRALPVGP